MLKRAASYVVVAVLAGLLVYLLTAQSENPTVQEPTSPTTEQVERDDVTTQDSVEDAVESTGVTTEPLDDLESGTLDDTDPSSLLLHPTAPAQARPARAERLADGDSFDIVWLDTNERDEVRMFGINAPEADACFGDVAKGVLVILTEDQELLIESIERDEFGRVLGNVWSDGVFVNATMVELGAALALSDGGRHAQLITQSQEAARSTSAGLWDPAACGADPTAQLRIAMIQADAPGRDDQNKNGEWIAIENDGATEADLTGWSIRDESTRHRFSFPDGHSIAPGDVTTVFSGCGNNTEHELFWCDDDPVWNNGGDTGFLVDPDGRFADSLSYDG